MDTKTIRFTSVLNPDKYGFVCEPSDMEHWDMCYRTPNILSYRAFYFETLGDGTTQHTPLNCVQNDGHIGVDWMLSLAHHLSAHPEDCEAARLGELFGYGLPNRESAQFVASIKEPKETDPAIYYSLAERKVSKSESKRHDKRWFQLSCSLFKRGYDLDQFVRLWDNGQETRSWKAIERIGIYLAMAESLDRSVWHHASDELPKWVSEDTIQIARVLRELILALESVNNSRRSVECVIGNHLRARQSAIAA
jgi:hypothetical protein